MTNYLKIYDLREFLKEPNYNTVSNKQLRNILNKSLKEYKEKYNLLMDLYYDNLSCLERPLIKKMLIEIYKTRIILENCNRIIKSKMSNGVIIKLIMDINTVGKIERNRLLSEIKVLIERKKWNEGIHCKNIYDIYVWHKKLNMILLSEYSECLDFDTIEECEKVNEIVYDDISEAQINMKLKRIIIQEKLHLSEVITNIDISEIKKIIDHVNKYEKIEFTGVAEGNLVEYLNYNYMVQEEKIKLLILDEIFSRFKTDIDVFKMSRMTMSESQNKPDASKITKIIINVTKSKLKDSSIGIGGN